MSLAARRMRRAARVSADGRRRVRLSFGWCIDAGDGR